MLERRTQQRGSLNMTWGLPVSEPLLSSMTDYHREVLRFVAMRLSKDADAVRKLEACRSWHEMSLVHNKWMQEIFRDLFQRSDEDGGPYNQKSWRTGCAHQSVSRLNDGPRRCNYRHRSVEH